MDSRQAEQCTSSISSENVAINGNDLACDILLEAAPRPATADELEALMASRRSIRRFEDRPLSRASLDRILNAAAMAPPGIPPSDVGVVVFHGRDRVQAFAADACIAFQRVARFFNPMLLPLMRPLWGREGYEVMRGFVKPLLELLAEKRSAGEDWFTYNAPAALLFHYGPMARAADCHIAATFAMLAAESLGLGSCLLGTTEALNHVKFFKPKYGIPPTNKTGLGLVLGYPAVTPAQGVARHLASVRFA
jgi:nitroreductase